MLLSLTSRLCFAGVSSCCPDGGPVFNDDIAPGRRNVRSHRIEGSRWDRPSPSRRQRPCCRAPSTSQRQPLHVRLGHNVVLRTVRSDPTQGRVGAAAGWPRTRLFDMEMKSAPGIRSHFAKASKAAARTSTATMARAPPGPPCPGGHEQKFGAKDEDAYWAGADRRTQVPPSLARARKLPDRPGAPTS
jgi:hypothetical protein